MMLDMSVRENRAFITTGKNAVIAGDTGMVTHQTPIQSIVPNASLTLSSVPPKGINVSRNNAGPRKRHIFFLFMRFPSLYFFISFPLKYPYHREPDIHEEDHAYYNQQRNNDSAL